MGENEYDKSGHLYIYFHFFLGKYLMMPSKCNILELHFYTIYKLIACRAMQLRFLKVLGKSVHVGGLNAKVLSYDVKW